MSANRILVVEDSKTQALKLQFLFEQDGYSVRIARDGEEALMMLGEEPFSLVVSDVIMPRMDGLELCSQLKANDRFKEIPILLLTSLNDEKAIIRALMNGANSFISKPIEPDHLISTCRSLIEGKFLDPSIQTFVEEHQFTNLDFSSLNFVVSALQTAIRRSKALEESERQLREINNSLEEAVRKRTLELDKARKKAERSDKLKSIFLSNVSHDLRTPMNAIMGFSELLREEKLEPEQKKEYHELIEKNGESLLQLINDIIDISKIEAGVISCDMDGDCQINDLLREMERTFANSKYLRRSQEVRIVFNRDKIIPDLAIKTDSFRLRQILSNLITNATKFTTSGTIEFSYVQADDHYLQFYVKDTGIGIPRDKIETLFRRYEQIKTNTSSEAGAGLGLAIAENLTKMLGGKMWIESELGKGSTFYFTIPYVPARPDSLLTESEQSAAYDKHNFSDLVILIVEDDEYNYRFLENTLTKVNANIIWAQDGEEALEVFKKNESIQLVLMDIGLPKMNGFVATRKIVKMKNFIPVIAQTAYVLSEDESKCYAAGCVDYIAKPVDPLVLLSKISKNIPPGIRAKRTNRLVANG